MKRLVLDFLARWCWVLCVCAALTVTTTAFGAPASFAPVVVICLLFDAGRGVFRTVARLPITRRDQALGWWLIAVVVVPLIWLAPLGLGAFLHQALHLTHPAIAPPMFRSDRGLAVAALSAAPGDPAIFAVAVQAWVGLGSCALLFLYSTLLPTRAAVGLRENITQGVIGAFWGTMFPGLMVMLPLLPRSPADLAPWHWAIFSTVPVLVVLSFLSSPELVRRRMVVPAALRRARNSEDRMPSGGLSGVPLFLATYAGRTVLMLLVIELAQRCVFFWIAGRRGFATNHAEVYMLPMQMAMFAMILAGLSGEWLNLRTLRTLPLTTCKLIALIVATPVVLSLVGGAFILVITALRLGGGLTAEGLVEFAAQVAILSGFGTLTLALMLHFTSGLRLLLLIFASEIPAVGDGWIISRAPLWAAAGGVAAFALAFFLIRRGLRRTTAFYQPRQWFGGGMGMGRMT